MIRGMASGGRVRVARLGDMHQRLKGRFGVRRGFGRFFGSVPVWQALMAANVGVFGLWHSGLVSRETMMRNFTLIGTNLRAGNYHTLLTYGFSHRDLLHFLMNMVGLWSFGRSIQMAAGGARLLQLYLLGTVVGGGLQLRYSGPYVPTLGASAATCSLLSYFILPSPQSTILLFFVPAPAWLIGLGFLGYTMYSMRTNRSPGTGHAAHFGGMVAGAMIFMITRGRF